MCNTIKQAGGTTFGNFADFLSFPYNYLLIFIIFFVDFYVSRSASRSAALQVALRPFSGAALRVALRATIRSGAPTALRSAALQCSVSLIWLNKTSVFDACRMEKMNGNELIKSLAI